MGESCYGSAPRRSRFRRMDTKHHLPGLPWDTLKAMTKPNGNKLCRRCGNPAPRGRTTLCDDCYGKCRTCGNPASQMPSGYYRPYCSQCRTDAETQDRCSKCGGPRGGSHASYCRLCYQEYDRQRNKRNRELRRVYGLTVEEWDSMLAAQGGGCAACGTTISRGKGRFHVDHDHRTEAIRGLLCATCNSTIALLDDSPKKLRARAEKMRDEAKRLDRMADYLDRHSVLTRTSTSGG